MCEKRNKDGKRQLLLNLRTRLLLWYELDHVIWKIVLALERLKGLHNKVSMDLHCI
jgi:hypothetical protein